MSHHCLVVYIFGAEDGEHLRIERRGDEVVFISHELQVTYVSTGFRERILFSMSCAKLQTLTRLLEVEGM